MPRPTPGSSGSQDLKDRDLGCGVCGVGGRPVQRREMEVVVFGESREAIHRREGSQGEKEWEAVLVTPSPLPTPLESRTPETS